MSVLSLLPDDKKKESRKESLESVYSSNSRLNLLQRRKRLNPLENMSQTTSVKGDKYVTQRVLSAKTHRVKQLQNQLADAHYHLQELSNENKVLRALQKKQEIALQRYENSNAGLPSVLNSHSEEMRVQQSKLKQLKQQFREVSQKLKERDMQLQQLRDEHQHLLELTKDRNLQEREKLSAQVAELSAKVQQQNETITMLQRRMSLEQKNFKHQLQNEINKHKDTRHDLDLAISNADKLTTIIEMKEKMLSTHAGRVVKSPTKPVNNTNAGKTLNRNRMNQDSAQNKGGGDDRGLNNMDLARICEISRNVTSALSHDEDNSSSIEPRSRYVRSRTDSFSTRSTRKGSKDSDDMIELAKSVQDGMAELAIFDDEVDYRNETPDEVQKRIEVMKNDLIKKIKNDEPISRKASAIRRQATEESIEEEIKHEEVEYERPKSRGRRHSTVSFYDSVNIEETTTTVAIYNGDATEENNKSGLERKLSGRPLEKYCKDIMQDIEKSSQVIDKHVQHFNQTQMNSDKIVQQLQTVDRLNDFVNSHEEIPEETLTELNNNFKMLTDQVLEAPIGRKRSISGRKSSRESRASLLGDTNISNQEMLEDLLGRK